MSFIKNLAAAAFALAVAGGSALAQQPAPEWTPVLILTPEQEEAKRARQYLNDCIDVETPVFENLGGDAREIFDRGRAEYEALKARIIADALEQAFAPFIRKAVEKGRISLEGGAALLNKKVESYKAALLRQMPVPEITLPGMGDDAGNYCIVRMLEANLNLDMNLLNAMTDDQMDLPIKDPLIYSPLATITAPKPSP